MVWHITRYSLQKRFHHLNYFINDFLTFENTICKRNQFFSSGYISSAPSAVACADSFNTNSLQSNQKYLSPSYYKNLSHQNLAISVGMKTCPVQGLCPLNSQNSLQILQKFYSTCPDGKEKSLSKKEEFKKAIKDYGATVVVFHVTISLVSLGCCYLAVSSGLNVGPYIPASLEGSSEIATEASLFVVAYAIHKVLAPVRVAITLASAPFIVRYLRKINVLKAPPQK